MRVQVRPRAGARRPPLPLRSAAIFLALAMAAVSTIAFALESPKSATLSDYLSRSSIAGRKLRVGVLVDQPLLGERRADGTLTGFDVVVWRSAVDDALQHGQCPAALPQHVAGRQSGGDVVHGHPLLL